MGSGASSAHHTPIAEDAQGASIILKRLVEDWSEGDLRWLDGFLSSPKKLAKFQRQVKHRLKALERLGRVKGVARSEGKRKIAARDKKSPDTGESAFLKPGALPTNLEELVTIAEDGTKIATRVTAVEERVPQVRSSSGEVAPRPPVTPVTQSADALLFRSQSSGALKETMVRMQNLDHLRVMFDRIDDDSSNSIEMQELVNFLVSSPTNKKKKKKKQKNGEISKARDLARSIFGRADADCSTSLDFTEFVEFVLTLIHGIFDVIDEDGSGTIDRKEFMHLLQIVHGNKHGVKGMSNNSKNSSHDKHTRKFIAKANHRDAYRAIEHLGDPIARDSFIKYMLQGDMMTMHVLRNLVRLKVDDQTWTQAKREAWHDVDLLLVQYKGMDKPHFAGVGSLLSHAERVK